MSFLSGFRGWTGIVEEAFGNVLEQDQGAEHPGRLRMPVVMEWLSQYPALKSAHMALAGASVGLFMARGLGVQWRATWPLRAGVRRASVLIDSLLLAAGGALWAILGLNPAHAPWLQMKLVLIVAYVVLGSLALKRARTPLGRALAFVGALGCVLAIVATALTHDVLGPLAPLRATGWTL
jgi:uncharacterized membrane protein SirB2